MEISINGADYNEATDDGKGNEQILIRDWSIAEEKKAKRK